jgi:hypothetical protein
MFLKLTLVNKNIARVFVALSLGGIFCSFSKKKITPNTSIIKALLKYQVTSKQVSREI